MSEIKEAFDNFGNKIIFYEEPHKYFINNRIECTSVTTLIHKFFPEFETDRIASEYAKKRGLDPEQVKKEWQDNCDEACRFGTQVHLFAEQKVVGGTLPNPANEKENTYFKVADNTIKYLLQFYNVVEAEKIIFCKDLALSGMIDLVLQDKQNNDIVLADWKTNKAIKQYNRFQKGLGRLEHLQDCNYNHYCLQLNIYRQLLYLGYYPRNVNIRMGIVHFTINGPVFYKIPVMNKEAQYILNKHKFRDYPKK